MKIGVSWWWKLPACERRITLSTAITTLRIIVTPILVWLLCRGYWTVAFWLFIGAATTDLLDGMIARAWNEQTLLGACLDPIADKILLVSCFATLAWVDTPFFAIPHWFVWLVLCKEALLVFGAIFLYVYLGSIHIMPTRLGKVTTFVQICFIAWIFVCYFFSWVPMKTYWLLLSVLLLMLIASLLQYGRIGFRSLRSL